MDILNEKIEGLVKKAEKSGMPYGILKKVYDRGMAAWRTGHRPGTTPQQWAFARVNSFVTKSSGTWGGADKDLAKQVKGESTEVPRTKSAKELIGQIKEKLPKDADAGDYVKDFRKSKAPQFKGKSDKKIQKMAIAAYLDSKEENVQEQIKTFNRNALTPSDKSKLAKHFDKLANDRTTTRNEKPYYQTLSRYVMGNVKPFEFNDMIGGAPEQVLGTIGRATASIIGKGKAKTFIPGFKEENLDEGKFTLPTTHVIVDKRTNKVTHASSDEKSLRLDVGRKSHLKIVKLKKPVSQKKTGYLLGEPLKAWGEEVDLEEADLTDKQVKMVKKVAEKLPMKDFKKRYGKDAMAVKFGTATNMVKKKLNIDHNDKHAGARQVVESIKAVKNKAEKTGMPYSILKQVYDRGMAAWKGGHRPGATQVQWALARVNSFVTKSSGTWGGADKDLAKKVRAAKK